MSYSYETLVHLIAGGIGGTIGAIITCPMEVIKTRLQSSLINFNLKPHPLTTNNLHITNLTTKSRTYSENRKNWQVANYVRYIIKTEGFRALFKGLGPNLIGVAPSRAIYFCTYSTVKNFCNETFPSPDTPFVHMSSAAAAGFVCCTITNPIWFIKTRSQLDQSTNKRFLTWSMLKKLYQSNGFSGFYKGITASYFGISETIIHFVIYENIKSKLRERKLKNEIDGEESNSYYFIQFMVAGAISKTIASIIAYPHEVARTRLRQEDNKYKKFFQTLALVYKEEGVSAIYRGLGMQLMRQIPNTAIMMGAYELIVFLLSSSNGLKSAD